MSRPQNLSNWEQLNDIQLPDIGGEEVTLLIGANDTRGSSRWWSGRTICVLSVLYLGGPLWVHVMATLEASLAK